jgi:hypothetical protein
LTKDYTTIQNLDRQKEKMKERQKDTKVQK